jgi:hypothetical protein
MATKEQQIAHLEDKLRRLKAQKKRLDKRDETRRKILYGAAFLALSESIEKERRRSMLHRVEQHITRTTDREFLGLPPLPSEQRESKASSVKHTTQSLPFGTRTDK